MKGLKGHVKGFILRNLKAIEEKGSDFYFRRITLVSAWIAQ